MTIPTALEQTHAFHSQALKSIEEAIQAQERPWTVQERIAFESLRVLMRTEIWTVQLHALAEATATRDESGNAIPPAWQRAVDEFTKATKTLQKLVDSSITQIHNEWMETMTQDEAWKVVGANVKRLRLAAEKTQAELAAAVHVSQPRIAQIEAGRKDCTVGLLADIAEFLGEPIDLLFRPEKAHIGDKTANRRLTA